MERLKQAARYTLDALKKAGADDAQVSVSEGKTEEFNVDAGEFSLIRSVYSSGASMKIIKNRRKGTVAVNQLDRDTIDAAVAECIAAADSGVEDDALSIASLEENADFKDGALVCDKAAFFDSVIKLTEDIRREYPQIMIEQLIATHAYGKHVLANTNGVLFTEEDGSYNVSVMYSAHDGENATSFNYFDFEFLDPHADILAMDGARTMLDRAVAELETRPFTGKFVGTAVFAPACLGDLLGIVTGSFTGDLALIEGTSIWKNKLGQQVADDRFTLSVIPHDPRIVCGERITSDGYRSEDYDVIKNGVLNSFCLSEYAANKTGLTRSKSTSGCIGVKPGDESLDKLIAGIEKGILVCRFSGGEPANNGDFSGVAKNSFLIENGKIAYPVSETMISGNMAEMLFHVRGFSAETVCDGSSVLPYAAFDGVTVSGGAAEEDA